MPNNIYLDNKYRRWYYDIINNALSISRTKNNDEYFESHHILPTSLGGTNNKNNLVLLTAREHFICHWLLIKFTQGNAKYKMMYALSFFTTRNISSRQYATSVKYNSISKQGRNNPMFGKAAWNKGISPPPAIMKNAWAGHKKWIESGGMTQEYKNKISQSLKGKSKPAGFGTKISNANKGKKHWSFNGLYCTPFGKFPNSTAIEDKIPNQLVRRWCKNCNKVITISSYSQNAYLQSLGKSVLGKTYKDIGFYFESV